MDKSKNSESKMSIKFRHEVGYNGIALDILKSGVQKYIRRGEFFKALWCAIEIFMFQCYPEIVKQTLSQPRAAIAPLLTKNEETRLKSIFTNFYHRLQVTFLEDVGLGGLNVWKKVASAIEVLKDKMKRSLKEKKH